jgi:hypothetical protein
MKKPTLATFASLATLKALLLIVLLVWMAGVARADCQFSWYSTSANYCNGGAYADCVATCAPQFNAFFQPWNDQTGTCYCWCC